VETLIQIIKQVPPVWPRVLLIAALLLLVALPHGTRMFALLGSGPRRLDRAKKLLEVRKLEIEVAALKAKDPHIGTSPLDGQISRILELPPDDDATESPLPWIERLKLAGIGAAVFTLFGAVAMAYSGRREGIELVTLVFWELVAVVPCALLASAIPAHARWGPVFYGLLVPVLFGAVLVTAGLQ
jgi:hypothetical protein